MFLGWIDDDEIGTLAGAPIIDPLMVSANKAVLIAWSKISGSTPLTDYGANPQDLVPSWTMRDGIMLHAFSVWWNLSGYTPKVAIGTGSPAQVVLDQEHANALAAWSGAQAGGAKIPQIPQNPIPIPPGGPPMPAPPGWPQGVPWPLPAPVGWPAGMQWPPLGTAAPPFGWPASWPWPPSPTNPPPGFSWPPPGWPANIPLPIPLPPGWTQPTQPTPPSTPTQPTLPTTPTQPTLPPAQTSTPAKKSNAALWIGGGLAALVAIALASQ